MMGKITMTIFIILFLVTQVVAQKKIPNVEIKTLDGKIFNTDSINRMGKPVFLSFWATWCVPCMKELDAINENIEDWKDEVDFIVVAVSIDDQRSTNRVAPLVNGKGWDDFVVLTDPNSNFKRAMNIVNVPHSMLLDKNGQVVWQHTSYSEGDEFHLFELIKKVAANEEIKE